MVTELFESREMHITSEGTELFAKLQATWVEFDYSQSQEYAELSPDARVALLIPIIGDEWSGRGDLRCTDIRSRTIDNTRCHVDVLYSTLGTVGQKEQSNQVKSWEENIEVGLESESAVSWYDADGDAKYAATLWEDAGYDMEYIPEFVKFSGRMEMRITLYGSKAYLIRILDNAGKINATQWLTEYSEKKTEADDTHEDDVAGFDDTKKWMFMGAPTTRIRPGCMRYDFMFSFNRDGWNTQYDIDTNMYKTYDFNSLFTGMDLNEPGEGNNLRT